MMHCPGNLIAPIPMNHRNGVGCNPSNNPDEGAQYFPAHSLIFANSTYLLQPR